MRRLVLNIAMSLDGFIARKVEVMIGLKDMVQINMIPPCSLTILHFFRNVILLLWGVNL